MSSSEPFAQEAPHEAGDECDIRLFAAETVYSSTYPLALYALYCFCCFDPFHNWIDDDL